MIGNNDWLDYMEYRDYIAHSMGMWDKSKVKYKEKIPVGGGKFRYIYDEPNRNRNASRRSVPTYFDKNQRDAERRNAERSSYSRRADTDRRVEARNRVRGIENSRRSMENNALTNRQNTNFNVYQRQQRAGYDAQRRAAEQQGMQNRATNNQQIEANKLARGYANQQRAAEQQMAQNHMNSDARMAQRQQMARADAERRDMERRTAQGRTQNELDVANKPKNLFDHMGRALGNAANAVGSALNSAGDWVGDRARDVGEWVGDRARDTSDWVDRNITGNSARDNAERKRDEANRASTDYWNAIGEGNIQDMTRYAANADKAYDEARQSQKEANNSLWGRIAGDDGRFDLSDIGRHASNAADAVAGAARDAGEWVGDRAKEVGEFAKGAGERAGQWVDENITGNTARSNAAAAYRNERSYNELADDAHRAAQNHFTDYQQTGNPDSRESAGILANWALDDRRRAEGARARGDYYQQQADNSLFGRVGNAANAAGQWFGDRVNEAGRAARNLYDQAGNAIGGVGDFIADRTGLTARNEHEAAKQNFLDAARAGYDARNNYYDAYDADPNSTETAAARDAYTRALQEKGAADRNQEATLSAYENSPLGRAEGAMRNVREFGEDTARQVGQAAGNAISAARGLIDSAGGNIAQALSWANQRLRYAQNTGNPEMIRDAQETVRTLESPSFNFRDRAFSAPSQPEPQTTTRTLESPSFNFRDRQINGMSPEYYEALASNSRKNVYFGDEGGRENGYYTVDPKSGQTVFVENGSQPPARSNTTTWDSAPTRTWENAESGSSGGYFTFDPQTGQTVYVDKDGKIIRR